MRIKTLKRMSGPKGNFPAGAELDVSSGEAVALVNAGAAEYIRDVVVETATVDPVMETATIRTAKPKAKRGKKNVVKGNG